LVNEFAIALRQEIHIIDVCSAAIIDILEIYVSTIYLKVFQLHYMNSSYWLT